MRSTIRWKFIAVAVGVVVIVAVILSLVFMRPGGPAGTGADANNASTTVTNSAPGSGTSTASGVPDSYGSGAKNIPALPGPAITIHLLTPISNNVWKEGQANPIAWDNAANVTGEIDLVDAKTKQFIGIILAQTGPKQTSYTWNAEQIYLGRYSADEKAVIPGVYSIRIHFDGNGLDGLVSGPITITN